MSLKRLQPGIYESSMVAIVLAASLFRIALISLHWPVTNSDEGVMDLMALHIANHGEHPIFFYGQEYMGPLEAYIGAGFFQIFGASVFALRLGVIPFFALFLVCMYFLTRLLYNRRLALVTVLLLSLGSSDIVTRQLKAIGGYPETFFFAAAIFLLASKIALSSYPKVPSEQERGKRWLLYGLLGFIVGLALWIDQLILPFIATTTLLLLLFCRREVFSYTGLYALLGLVLGALPLIYYNLTSPLEHNSLVVLLNLQRAGIDDLATRHIPRIQQLVGAFFISLPAITALNPLCTIDNFPLFGQITMQNLHCTLVQGGWALGYTMLWIWAVILAGYRIWQSFSRTILLTNKDREYPDSLLATLTSRPVLPLPGYFQRVLMTTSQANWPYTERQACIKQCARLLLLLSAALSFMLYATSPGAALSPATNTRYLICMLVALPAVLWPLWKGHNTYRERGIREKRRLLSLLLQGGILLLIAFMFISGTIRIITDIPNAQANYAAQQALIDHLEHIGAARIYTDYWTCYRLAFQSNERIICAPLTEDLQRGPESVNRYAPYFDQVRAFPQPTYVFPRESIQAANFASRILSQSRGYIYSEFGDYIVYQYAAPVGIP